MFVPGYYFLVVYVFFYSVILNFNRLCRLSFGPDGYKVFNINDQSIILYYNVIDNFL